jgi:hypothetical protein
MEQRSFRDGLIWILHQRSVAVALGLWIVLSMAGAILSRNVTSLRGAVASSSFGLAAVVLLIGVAAFVTRHRPVPHLAERAPERNVALKEALSLWIYGAAVMIAGRLIGQHLFGEGIALHLNGSIVGATRVQSPAEVYTWAAYNFVLIAVIPYAIFRGRGYSNRQLNLKSENRKNDFLLIVIVLLLSCAFDFTGPNILQLTRHQQIIGGVLSFVLHMFGTDLPIMIFIYAILVPRYARLFSPMTAYLLGAASYPTMHVFESGTHYNTLTGAALSLIFVYLGFFPAGLMKSFLTFRTGNAWVHLWAFHAISPHVTVDTRLVVADFHIN